MKSQGENSTIPALEEDEDFDEFQCVSIRFLSDIYLAETCFENPRGPTECNTDDENQDSQEMIREKVLDLEEDISLEFTSVAN